MPTFHDPARVGAAHVLANNTPTAVSLEVRTLSDTEALIVAAQPLEGDRMLLLLEMTDQDDCLIDADIVHRSEYHQNWMGGRDITYVACRFRFRRKFAKSDLHESLLAAFPIAEDPECDIPANENEFQSVQPQLMPLLSAIGIVVVHTWGMTL